MALWAVTIFFGAATVLSLAVAVRAKTQGPVIRIGSRHDGYIEAEDLEGAEMSFGGRPIRRMNGMLIGFTNTGSTRVNIGDTETPIVIKLRPAEADSNPIRIMTVDEHGKRIAEDQVEIDVEGMHSGSRRTVRVQYSGDRTDSVEVSGSVRGEARPVTTLAHARRASHAEDVLIWFLTLTAGAFVAVGFYEQVLGDGLLFGFQVARVAIHIEPAQVTEISNVVGVDIEEYRSPEITDGHLLERLRFGLVAGAAIIFVSAGTWIWSISISILSRIGAASLYPFEQKHLDDF